MRIVDIPNTYGAALKTIEKYGFRYELRESDSETELGLWRAYLNEIEVEASDPLSLLALVSISVNLGQKWEEVGNGPYRREIERLYGDDEYED